MIRPLLFLLLTLSLPGLCAPYTGEGFRQLENQPSNIVYDILIDRKGYVWIGHELGLSRYNGLSFRTFHHPRQSTLGVSNLVEDKYGRIWYRNFNGQIFYIQDEKVSQITPVSPSPYLHAFVILDDELMTRSGESLLIYNIRNHQSQILYTTSHNTPLNKVNHLYSNGSKIFLLTHVYDRNRILTYDNGIFTLLRFSADTDIFPSRIMLADKEKITILSGTEKVNPRLITLKITDTGLVPNATIKYDETTTSHYVWATHDQGKFWVHNHFFSHTPYGKDSINGLAITDIVTDREGNTWVSSMIYGLMLKKKTSNWLLLSEYGYKNAFRKIDVFRNYVGVTSFAGNVVIMDTTIFPYTSEKQVKYNENKNSMGWLNLENQLYLFDKNEPRKYPSTATIGKIYNSAPKDVCIIDGRVMAFSTPAGIIALTDLPKDSLPSIITAHFDHNTENGIYRNITGQRVRSVAYNPTYGILYAGFSHGLFLYTDTSVTELRWNNLPIYAYRILYHKGKTYVATQNSGVLIIEKDQIITTIDLNNGLSSPTVVKLKIYGNHLWLSCLEEIQVYDLDQKMFIQSYSLPPVKSSQVYDLAEVNGYVYFAAINGLYKITLDKTREKDVLPLNYLSSVIVNGTDTVYEDAILASQKNNLQINLDALYYADAERVFFTYRLLGPGNDTNWTSAPPGQNKILLSYLPPGSYQFEARAHTANGLAAATPVSFSFTINKPWWQQSWFLLSITGIIAGSAIIYTRNRINIRKKQNQAILEKLQHEKALNESELKALKSQMNPHFIFNSLNTIQEMFMWGDKNAANEQMANFATLTRLILTVSEKRSISLSTETEILKKYLELEKMRFQENFSYEIIMNEEVDEGYIQIPPMIIQPFVENSIKHGLLHKEGAKKLSIIFQLVRGDEYIACIIRDNGIGRKRAAEIREAANYNYSSFSTAATKKRLQLINNNMSEQILITYTDLKDETGHATGTSVRIMIPTFV